MTFWVEWKRELLSRKSLYILAINLTTVFSMWLGMLLMIYAFQSTLNVAIAFGVAVAAGIGTFLIYQLRRMVL